MLAPLLAITLALPVTGQDSMFEVSAWGRFSYFGYSSATTPAFSDAQTLEGAGGGTITGFFTPVVDDEAPPSLQPFLQHVGNVTLSGGGSSTTYSRPPQLGVSGGTTVGQVRVGLAGYVSRWLTFDGSFAVHYEQYHRDGDPNRPDYLSLPLRVSAGLRWEDLVFFAGWSVTPQRFNDDAFKVPFWGGVSVGGYGVIRRRVSVQATVDVLEGGAAGDAGFNVWMRRRLGLGLGGGGGHTSSQIFQTSHDFIDGRAHATVWMTPRAAVGVVYEAEWYRYAPVGGLAGVDTLRHSLSVEVSGRPW